VKNPAFELYGIFGHPLGHTLSPVMQEAAFRAAGRKAFYVPFDLSEREYLKILQHLPRLILDGFNVTVPYKEVTARRLKYKTAQAREMGAVNTVYRQGRRWIGTNTDADGFCRALLNEGRFRVQGKPCLVLGAGGAARAAVYGLAREKAASVLIVNRDLKRARKLAADFQPLFKKTKLSAVERSSETLIAAVRQAQLVVNATSVGMKKEDPAVLESAWIPPAGKQPKLFYDLIYRPAETVFLKQARQKKHRTLNGMMMLVYQGARAFECWTGKPAPEDLMRQELERALKAHG
jgi:shikimate dehydrogenase